MKKIKFLFGITIFLNAFLLFLVEPMFNRILTPMLGSSVSIWNVAVMCFQIILLGGYLYAHYLPKAIGYKNYIKVHIIILLAGTVLSFLFFNIREFQINTNNPTLDLIFILLSTIAFPFFVLSTSTTNFQKWYSSISNENPYYLYSLSNAGNLIALISYGLVIEVFLGFKKQILFWNILLFVASVMGCFIGIIVYKTANKFTPGPRSSEQKNNKVKMGTVLSLNKKFYWLLLSFIPCALMTATNTLLGNTINVVKIPYYWLIPLIVYLLAYIIAFSNIKLFQTNVFEKLAFWASMFAFCVFFISNDIAYIISIFALFIISLVCNLYLVEDKPEPYNLTEFYLYIAIGGALGGIFATLAAPLIFTNVYEYLLILAIFLILMLYKHKKENIKTLNIEQWEYSIIFAAVLLVVIINGISYKLLAVLLIFFFFFIIRSIYVYQQTRFLSIFLLFSVIISFNYAFFKNIVYQARNFYCIKQIMKTDYIDENNKHYDIIKLLDGNTVHGQQFAAGSDREFEGISYYHKDSAIGRFLTENKNKIKNIGVVGLGIGVLSVYSTESQNWTYFEIDPQIIEIAKNKEFFSIVDKYKPNIIQGDARITLKEQEDKYSDVLILDAYSGGLIPTSLLTIEAIELYKSKLKDDGILMFHISNNQYDLKPVLSKAAEYIGMKCYIDSFNSRISSIYSTSEWVMMTNNNDYVNEYWKEINKYDSFKLWTDDRHSILTILK